MHIVSSLSCSYVSHIHVFSSCCLIACSCWLFLVVKVFSKCSEQVKQRGFAPMGRQEFAYSFNVTGRLVLREILFILCRYQNYADSRNSTDELCKMKLRAQNHCLRKSASYRGGPNMKNTYLHFLTASLVVALALVAVPAISWAGHVWGNYHWERAENPLQLNLGDNLRFCRKQRNDEKSYRF